MLRTIGVSDGMDEAAVSLPENVRRIASAPLLAPPGAEWRYSIATDVLGAVIERASGPAAGAGGQKWVTGPLAMTDTDFRRWTPRARRPLTLTIPASHAACASRIVYPSSTAAPVFICRRRVRWIRRRTPPAAPAWSVRRRISAPAGNVAPGRAGTANRLGGGADHQPNRRSADAVLAVARLRPGITVLKDPVAAQTPESVGSWRMGGTYGHSWFVDPARQLSVVAFTNTALEGMSGAFVGEICQAVYAATGVPSWA